MIQITIHETNVFMHPSNDPKAATDDAESMLKGEQNQAVRVNYNKNITTAQPTAQKPAQTQPLQTKVQTVTTGTAPGQPVTAPTASTAPTQAATPPA